MPVHHGEAAFHNKTYRHFSKREQVYSDFINRGFIARASNRLNANLSAAFFDIYALDDRHTDPLCISSPSFISSIPRVSRFVDGRAIEMCSILIIRFKRGLSLAAILHR